MPIKVKDNLPAKGILRGESIFVMGEDRAFHQDIRPLKILVVNLMPNKQQTEVQILRLLSNTPLQLQVTFIRMEAIFQSIQVRLILMSFTASLMI